MILAQYQY